MTSCSAGRPGPDGNARPFDGARAYQLLAQQVSFGPRSPLEPSHAACRDWLVEQLEPFADRVVRQDFSFTSQTTFPGQRFDLTNIIAVIDAASPSATGRRMVCAHWDTRPFADRDPDPARRSEPIPGANDGASGVAVVLELARVLSAQRPPQQVVLVLFDGEDFGRTIDEYFLGSRYFADHMGEFRPDSAILLDMVGDADLGVGIEGHSLASAPDLVDRIWQTAADLGYGTSFPTSPRPAYTIEDDHISLIDAGVPAVDVIDFNYPYWHTTADTVDKCSASSLKAVGDVVVDTLQRLP